MCRAKNAKNGRRCGCDNSESRRLRRYNSVARERNASLVSKILPRKLSPSHEKDIYIRNLSEEKVIVQIANLNNINAEIKDAWIAIHLNNENVNRLELLLKLDKAYNDIGAAIEVIAESKYGAPNDEKFRQSFNKFKQRSDRFKDRHIELLLKKGKSASEAEKIAKDKASAKFDARYRNVIGKLLDARNSALKKSLTDVGVQFADPNSIEFESCSDRATLRSLKEALTFYPQRWIDDSNDANVFDPLYIESMKGYNTDRAFYAEDIITQRPTEVFASFHSILAISNNTYSYYRKDDGMEAAIHEFGHRIEHVNYDLTAAEDIFLRRRIGHIETANGPTEKDELSSLYPESKYKHEREEVAFKDHFPEHYMGKVYPDRFREIFTMGMETLFAGSNGAFAGIDGYSDDPDYKRFMLGLLASSVN